MVLNEKIGKKRSHPMPQPRKIDFSSFAEARDEKKLLFGFSDIVRLVDFF